MNSDLTLKGAYEAGLITDAMLPTVMALKKKGFADADIIRQIQAAEAGTPWGLIAGGTAGAGALAAGGAMTPVGVRGLRAASENLAYHQYPRTAQALGKTAEFAGDTGSAFAQGAKLAGKVGAALATAKGRGTLRSALNLQTV